MRRIPPNSILEIILLILIGSVTAGCTSQKDKPGDASAKDMIVVTDLAGRQVSIGQPVKRIVLMRSLCMYELATVLGDETAERLVGWDSSLQSGDHDAYEKFVKRFPSLANTTVLGDVLKDAVSAESVIALKPDLVILNTYMKQRNSKGLERLENAGVPILYLEFDDPFRDPQRSIRLLGKVLGKEQRANEAAQWVDAQLAPVLAQQKTLAGKVPSLYMEAGTYGASKYGNTFGSNEQGKIANWASVMSQLRCHNIASGTVTGMYGLGVIRPEYLLSENPDVVVFTGANWTAFPDSLRLGYYAEKEAAQSALHRFGQRSGWSDLRSVKKGQVYGIHTRFGSHITSFAAAQQLSKWLYPGEFSALDPEESLRQFHQKFLPIEFSGTWMVSWEGSATGE
ncbi:ABC transporter substrate-binding protein [Blastopirellula marina]|uniref:Iron complex transporter substrate-binding protein n=1 Tax=Blastopirellula marina TaxID=124 RepID=A0A2S8FNF6_9BACT|nr:ABC transporter substrate-binding protein [Blastopirellula marina]PQO33699.1 iron complex transporter substrate-binding protein [Blastopirellula marina]PTL43486.1 iron complex transporter substrate-binding protein [Blastopirellula marina]